MTSSARNFLVFLGLTLASLPGAAGAASPLLVSPWADPLDPTHFHPDSLWADRLAADSARAYRDSLRLVQGAAEALSADPLTRSGRPQFSYNATYSIGQNNTSWVNTARYSQLVDRLALTNSTDITLDRYYSGGAESPRQTRNSTTELLYRISPNLRLGGRANLFRFLSASTGLLTTSDREDKDEYQLSSRAEVRPTPFMRGELNVFGGYIDNQRPSYFRKGFSGDVNGRVNFTGRNLASLDVSGQANGNSTRATLNEATAEQAQTHDRNRMVRGSLALLPGYKIGMALNGSRRNIQTQTPITLPSGATQLQEVLTHSGDLAATLQGRWTTERSFLVGRRFFEESRDYNVQTSQSSGRDDAAWNAELHDLRWGTKLDVVFSTSENENDYSLRTTSTGSPAGYVEQGVSRSLEATLSRSLGTRLTGRVRGQVRLTQSRYEPVPNSSVTLADRDLATQSILLEARYNPGRRWNTSLTYQQDLNENVNLDPSQSGNNFDEHIYRLTWNWSYALSSRFTANQRNSANANYRLHTFRPASDRVRIEYNIVTTLEGTLSSRFRMTVTHSARYQPEGQYVVDPLTGVESFYKSDESRLYSLDTRFSYSPAAWLTLNLNPIYQNDQRLSAQADQMRLLRSSANLRVLGGVAVNRRVGAHGNLSGDLNRSYVADRATSYTSAGEPIPGEGTEVDYWQGRLDFTWTY
jgi:hypothetical protein